MEYTSQICWLAKEKTYERELTIDVRRIATELRVARRGLQDDQNIEKTKIDSKLD